MVDLSLSAAAQNRTPTSLGLLSRSALPSLLVNLAKRSLTGSLLLKTTSGAEYALFVRNGSPSKVEAPRTAGRLGEILVKQGKADAATLQSALERALRENRPIGELLVTERIVELAALEGALRTQIVLRLGLLAALPGDTVFEFYVDIDLIGARGVTDETPVDFLASTLAAVRGWQNPVAIDETLQRLANIPLTLHSHAAPERFGFSGPERGILKTLQATSPHLRTLLSSGVDPALARVVVYTLAITRHLDFGTPDAWPLGVRQVSSAQPSAGPADRAVAPPSGRHITGLGRDPLRGRTTTGGNAPSGRAVTQHPVVDDNVRAKEIKDRERLLGGDLYALLGVGRKAGGGEIQAAYFTAAKILHPDRIPPELDALKTLASKIFSEVSRAHRTLCDAKKRAEYDASLVEQAAGDGEVERVMRALVAFQRAEIFLKRGDFASAEPFAEKAVEGDPNQGQYLAALGWIRAAKGEADLPAASQLLEQAVALSPASDQAQYFRAVVLKRLGRDDEALRGFRKVCELNPHHVDAAREVRLYTMKRDERKRTDAGTGLGKLFRK